MNYSIIKYSPNLLTIFSLLDSPLSKTVVNLDIFIQSLLDEID